MNFASLFSGCGGFDIGFISEGFTPVAAYDLDQSACLNFEHNIGKHIFNVDLTRQFPEKNKLNGIDVLIAGPPCQGFSTAGKRNVDDKRNHLLTHTAKLATEISPKVLVVENVPGVLAGAHSKYWEELIFIMNQAGYHTQTIKCETSSLGMPQVRKRVLLFAWRTNHHIDFIPEKITPQPLSEALKDIDGLPNHDPKLLPKGSKDWEIAKCIRQGQKLSNVRGGINSVATWDIPNVFGKTSSDERTVLELIRRLRRQERKRTFGDADPVAFDRLEHALGPKFIKHVSVLISKGYLKKVDNCVDLTGTFNGKYRRLDKNLPSCTVDTRFGSARYFLHPTIERGFTVREAARLQGFNDEYVFQGTEQAQFRVIGNAVPPPLGAYAARITKQLLGSNI